MVGNATLEKKMHLNNGKDNKSKVLRAYHATKPAFFEEVVLLGFFNEDRSSWSLCSCSLSFGRLMSLHEGPTPPDILL